MTRALLLVVILLSACASPNATPSPTVEPTPTASPTPGPKVAWEAIMCGPIDDIPKIGQQMLVLLKAVFEDQDLVAATRERAKLDDLASDLTSAMARAPEFQDADRFMARLGASLTNTLKAFDQGQEGLAVSDPNELQAAAGLFQAALVEFDEAKAEFQTLGAC